MPEQTFTDIQPIQQNFTDIQPIVDVGVPEKEKVGFFKRFAQAYGVPTSLAEAAETTKSSVEAALTGGIAPVIRSTIDYAERVPQAAREYLKEAEEAGENIGAGGPVFANIGKAEAGGTNLALQATPFIGPSLETAGEDIAKGNWPGGLGGAAAVASQILLARSPEARQKAASTFRVKAALDPAAANEIVGRGVQQQIINADLKLHQEVGKHAQNVQDAVDTANPQGALDAKPYVKALQDGLNEYISTFTRMGLKIPSALNDVVNEALQSPRWSFAQAKDIRSALQVMREKSGDAKVRAALTPAIKELTGDMKSAADTQGVGADFDIYNDLHHKQMMMREQVLDKVKDSVSGENVMDTLKNNEGYVKVSLPDLAAYGLDKDAVLDAMDISKAKTGQSRMWHSWALRHAGGTLFQITGLPWIAGYAGTGMAQEALRGARATVDIGSPMYQAGEALMNKSRIAPPSSVAEPATLPFTPKGFGIPGSPGPKTYAPIRLNPSITSPETGEAAPTPAPSPSPEPASKYEATRQSLAEAGMLRKAIGLLTRGGKRSMTDTEMAKVEEWTGLDMSKPENVTEAVKRLKARMAGENK